MISGLKKTPLKVFGDKRGKVMRMLREDDPHFFRFGEIYFSWIYTGVIKAWKLQKKMTINFAIPVGTIKLVAYDERSDSQTLGQVNEFILSEDDYFLLTIPPNIWYGFEALKNKSALVANCTTLPHSLYDTENREIIDPRIPFKWK